MTRGQFLAVIVGAVALAAALVAASQLGARDAPEAAPAQSGLFTGIPHGRQSAENAGWVTGDVLVEVAREAGLDPADLAERRHEAWADAQLAASHAFAEASGVQGTPSFQFGRTGGPLERLGLDFLAPEAITPAARTCSTCKAP
jgi:hypothetical protein